MTVQISTLAIRPDIDASSFSAGARDMANAQRQIVSGAREVSVAMTDASGKISTAGDPVARLSRQFVSGYGEMSRFTTGMRSLNNILETGRGAEHAAQIYQGMTQKLGLVANAADLTRQGYAELGAMVERVNAQILRQSTELSSAESANRKFNAANSNAVSAGASRAAGFNAGQQVQDIAMMSLMGQSPGILALQQGPQLASAIQQGGGLAALGSGLGSMLNLTMLLTVGFTAATAATIQWATKGKEGAKSLDEALKSHSETLSLLKRQYGELGEAAKGVGPVGGAAFTEARARSEVDTLRAAIRSQSGDLSKEFSGSGLFRGGLLGSLTGGLDTLLSTKNSPYQQAIDDLLSSIRSGNGGLEKFDGNLNKIFDDLRGKSSDPAKLADEMQRLSDAALDAFSVSGKMSPFQGEIDRLLLGLKEGDAGLSTFSSNVRGIGELNGLGKQADDAILAAKEVVGLAEKLREVEQILRRIDQENTRPGLRDQRYLQHYVAGRDADARILDQQFAADQQLARARTNAERLAAVESQVRSRARDDGDSGGGLQARINRALAEERTRQEVEARAAAIQRSQALDRSIDQQRLELGLIGQTSAEQTKLRFEFERMQELREQAARTGEPIDLKEIANIRAAADAMRLYAGAIGAANEIKSQGENLAQLRLQLALVGQNATVQAKALAQYETEVKILDLGIDRYGQMAEMMRTNTRASADLAASLERQAGAWNAISGTATNSIDRLVDSAASGFKDIDDALTDVAKDMLKTSLQLTVANPLKNWLTGSDLPEMGDLKSMGGALGRLFGMSPTDPTSAVTSALGDRQTAMMNVSAAVVNITGGGLGLAGAPDDGGGLISRLFSAANSNVAKTAAGALIPGAGPLIGAAGSLGGGGIAQTAWDFFRSKGLADYQVAGILGNMKAESAFNPLAAGDGGNALGLFQWNDRSSDLLKFLGGRGNLGDVNGQLNFAWKELQTTESGALSRLLASKDVRSATSAFGGFERPSGWSLDNPEAMHNFTGRLTGANQALAKFGGGIDKISTGALSAGKGLDTLGNGAGKLGNLLNQFPAAPGGGGGGLGGLLGGGLSSIFSGSAAYSWLSANPGGYIGLYADGTENAPPGWAWVGERGPELMRMRGGETIRSNSRSQQMMADGSGGGGANVSVVVNNAPAGTRTRERTRSGPDGRELREIVVDIMDDHIANGGADSAFAGRYGARPVTAVRGR